MPERIESPLIASPLRDEPSPIELISALGDDSPNFLTVDLLRSYALKNLPPKEQVKLFAKEEVSFVSLAKSLKDFFDSVTVLGESEPQTVWLPTWEVHVPKVKGCSATLQRSSSHETDYSLSVKVFGIGGGTSKSRKVGFKETIQTKGECLQVRLPITITTQDCVTRKGEKFTRVNVKDIGTVSSTVGLKEPSDPKSDRPLDRCGTLPDGVAKAGWDKRTIDIGTSDATHKIDMSIGSSQAAELNLEPTVLGITVGMKAILKLEKEISYSYELVGPHCYLAYFPRNSIAWYWTKLATSSDVIKVMIQRSTHDVNQKSKELYP